MGSRPERDGAHPQDLDVDYTVGIDEAAFYGPKLDIQYKNVYGKEDTLVTIQIDMLLAERFGMYYIDENGEKKLPYIIHRTSLGCYERTLAYLIEEYAARCRRGWRPSRCASCPSPIAPPTTAPSRPRSSKTWASASRSTTATRRSAARSATRRWRKVPYMLVVGDRDMENGTVSPRHRADGDLGAMSMDEFSALLKQVVDNKEKSK